MPEYAVIKQTTPGVNAAGDEFIRIINRPASELGDPAFGFDFRPVSRVTNDTSTLGPLYVVDDVTKEVLADSYVITRTHRDMTAQEIDDVKEQVATNLLSEGLTPVIKQLLEISFELANQIRVNNGQGAITPTQFKNAVLPLDELSENAIRNWLKELL